MSKTETTKSKSAKRVTNKRPTVAATPALSRNGTRPGRMSEKTKQLTIRAFQKVYKSYQRKTAYQ